MSNPVTDYYNQDPALEWNRLFITPYRRVEYEVVLYFLDKFLPESGSILDLGGGPGRYTLELAKRGYTMTLADIAQANLDYAKTKIANTQAARNVQGYVLTDGLDLSQFQDGSFDAILCMGPLYHMPKEAHRLQCLQECWRLLKPGAPLFVMVIPRCTYIRDALRSEDFGAEGQAGLKVLEEIFEQGTSTRSRVPNTYFCYPQELQTWLEQSGFDIEQMASSHGFASFMDEKINRLAANAETWNGLIKLILATCTDPGSFTAAEHLFCVAKKKRA